MKPASHPITAALCFSSALAASLAQLPAGAAGDSWVGDGNSLWSMPAHSPAPAAADASGYTASFNITGTPADRTLHLESDRSLIKLILDDTNPASVASRISDGNPTSTDSPVPARSPRPATGKPPAPAPVVAFARPINTVAASLPRAGSGALLPPLPSAVASRTGATPRPMNPAGTDGGASAPKTTVAKTLANFGARELAPNTSGANTSASKTSGKESPPAAASPTPASGATGTAGQPPEMIPEGDTGSIFEWDLAAAGSDSHPLPSLSTADSSFLKILGSAFTMGFWHSDSSWTGFFGTTPAPFTLFDGDGELLPESKPQP